MAFGKAEASCVPNASSTVNAARSFEHFILHLYRLGYVPLQLPHNPPREPVSEVVGIGTIE
jgi:hypothetical protein